MGQRQTWDLGRFFQTLTYFEIIPFIGNNSWLRNMILGDNNQQPAPPKLNKLDTILVAGATGGTGRRVMKRLIELNYPVRALVRSIERAKPILGEQENLEYYEGDITIPSSLKPELMRDVKAIICCTGTRVQAVGGDTPDRAKYYQGVKFYQPEIAESTPEAVEYNGIKNLVKLATIHLPRVRETTIFDFSQPSDALKLTWGAVDDVVMGGVSESQLRLIPGAALFSGNVSTANSGGFVSVRNRNFDPPLDLSSYEGIQLRIKGDGKRYKFIMRSEGKWDGISYCYSFDTLYNYWLNISIPFADLRPVFRAKTLTDVGEFDASRTYSMQLMLSKFEYDGELNPKFEAGSFQLQIESIKAYGGKKIPQLVMISSAGVTRPNRPGIDLATEPPAVRMNDMLGGILTWKLKGEETVRNSGLNYTIIRPCALTEKTGGKALLVDQGDNIKGQVSREDIAELCVQAIQQPTACNKTFEVKEDSNTQLQNWAELFSNLKQD